RLQSGPARCFCSCRVDRPLPGRSLGKLARQVGHRLLEGFVASAVGLAWSRPPARAGAARPWVARREIWLRAIGAQYSLKAIVEIDQPIGLAEKDAATLHSGHVRLSARRQYGLDGRVTLAQPAQQAQFIRLAQRFQVREQDVDTDTIDDASRLIRVRRLDHIEARMTQMLCHRRALAKLVVQYKDNPDGRSGTPFRSNRLFGHGEPGDEDLTQSVAGERVQQVKPR